MPEGLDLVECHDFNPPSSFYFLVGFTDIRALTHHRSTVSATLENVSLALAFILIYLEAEGETKMAC